jgi:hypothetical protein
LIALADVGVTDLVLLVAHVEHLAWHDRGECDVRSAARPADLQDDTGDRPP